MDEAIRMLSRPLGQPISDLSLLQQSLWQIDHLADHNISKYIESLQRAIDDEAAGRIKPVLRRE